jgi:acyl phosphate:glycerol-3-phosphate acyltransferase
MTTAQQLIALIPVAYVLGSVPFGLIVGLSKGVDPRKAGSGNIGATNLGRLLGGKFFALTFTLDLLKGLAPTLAASIIVYRGQERTGGQFGTEIYLLWLAVALAAILGHMFSLFLKFRGGKGISTSVGIMLGIFPDFTIAAGVLVVVFLVVFFTSRIISLASMIGAGAFPIAYAGGALARGQSVLGERWPLLAFAVVVAALVLWKHRANIKRLRAGTEPKFVAKRSAAA